MPIADWYFDFISPFAYLQSERLHTLGPKVSIRYRPVLFAALLEANGQRGPAEIPAKRAFTYRFCLWQAKQLGIPMRFPPEHPFNPLALLRLAIACDSSAAAVHAIFRFVWRDGRLPDLPIEWAELVGMLGIESGVDLRKLRIAGQTISDFLGRPAASRVARALAAKDRLP